MVTRSLGVKLKVIRFCLYAKEEHAVDDPFVSWHDPNDLEFLHVWRNGLEIYRAEPVLWSICCSLWA